MTNPYQPKVQQKMAHTRLILSLLDGGGTSLLDRQRSEAIMASAILNLGVALGLYFKELGLNSQLQNVEQIHDLEQLEYALKTAGKVDVAVTELRQLQDSGWLRDFLLALSQVQYPAPAFPVPGAVQMISAEVTQPLTLSESWLQETFSGLEQMVDRQRHSNLEY